MKCCRPPRAGNSGTVLDQQPSEAAPLHLRLDEQAIEIDLSVEPRFDCCESRDYSAGFDDEHIAGLYLFERYLDDLRMREDRLAVARIGQSRAALKFFEAALLGHLCPADQYIAHGWKIAPAW